ncbi:methyltransferase domain-containing protein [Acidipila sp. 4G-K13]|uniref:Methyltransferase domain-containing protein n=2 Tax=Paracidobacterium acidisoli TaxID=2303751 RepID=A0A372ISV4_9BACT|nr:methyltransferase domain-containing protein [Paracidobacterium acidisoli]
MQMAWGFALPLAIQSAVTNHIFDTLAGGGKTPEEIAAATGVAMRGLPFLLNILTEAGLLKAEGERYALTAESERFLVSSSPAFHGVFFAHVHDLIEHWLALPEAIRTGVSTIQVNEQSGGAEFFESFVEAIFPTSYPAAQTLARALRLGEVQDEFRVVDLGAGSGVWGIAAAQASPRVHVTAVDWPNVLNVTRRVAARMGVAEQFDFLAGNLRDVALPGGTDLITIGHILHSEGERHSRSLLERCYAALKPGGRIAIQEFLLNDDRRGPMQPLMFGLNMLVHTTEGSVWSAAEIGGWLRDAGFTDVELLPAPGPSPLILARK